MGSGQGWLESDKDYRDRMEREANEKVVEGATGKSPSQGWLESDKSYAERVANEANEQVIKSSSGSAPSQGWFESNESYQRRLEQEANEATIKRSSGSAPSQGWLESDESYNTRVRREANERIISDDTGESPHQGWFESDRSYRQRINHEANIRRSKPTSKTASGSSGGEAAHYGSSTSSHYGGSDWAKASLASGVAAASKITLKGIFFTGLTFLITAYAMYQFLVIGPMKSQYKSLSDSAVRFASVGDYARAENEFTRAYLLAKELGGSYPKELLSLRSRYYEVGQIQPGSRYVYEIRGSTTIDMGGIFDFSRKRCTFNFKANDHRRIFTTSKKVSVRLPRGRDVPLRNGTRVSDLVPSGQKICLGDKADGRRRALFFKSDDQQQVTLFFVN